MQDCLCRQRWRVRQKKATRQSAKGERRGQPAVSKEETRGRQLGRGAARQGRRRCWLFLPPGISVVERPTRINRPRIGRRTESLYWSTHAHPCLFSLPSYPVTYQLIERLVGPLKQKVSTAYCQLTHSVVGQLMSRWILRPPSMTHMVHE